MKRSDVRSNLGNYTQKVKKPQIFKNFKVSGLKNKNYTKKTHCKAGFYRFLLGRHAVLAELG